MSSPVADPDLTRRPPVRLTQAERRDVSERLLVEATLSVVARRGVGAATFDAIGQTAGYSRGLATQRFGSKQGLIDAVITYLHARRDAVMDAAHVADMEPLEAVLYYADSHLRLLDQDVSGRAYFMLMAGAVADASSLQAAFAASHDRVRLWLAERVRAGQAAGRIRAGLDPDGVALMVGSLLLGVSIQWLADPTTPLGLIRRTSLALLRDSLSAQPEPEPLP
jgi:AcrR family transcriptional regulator